METRSIPTAITDLPHADLLRLLPDIVHRMIIHHGLWFAEVRHQMGLEKAMSALGKCFEASLKVQMKRLSETLKFDLVDGMPRAIATLPK